MLGMFTSNFIQDFAMLTLVERLSPDAALSLDRSPQIFLALRAEDRRRSRLRCEKEDGQSVQLILKRGTVLRDGDILKTIADGAGEPIFVRVIAKPEAVVTIKASEPLALLRAAYHLGNRHIALEVHPDYLRLLPDPVLEQMLENMAVTLTRETVPFHPEAGAYHHHHG